MTEYWFYHLETSTLENVLPELLGKTIERGWRALVKVPDSMLEHLDGYLWTYQDASFLPHGRDDEPQADRQPILLSADASGSEGFDCVFLVDGQDLNVSDSTTRCIVMINGRDADAVQSARAQWTRLKKTDANLSYWQQNDRGRWEKKA